MTKEERLFEPLFFKAIVFSMVLHIALFAWVAFGGTFNLGSDNVRVIPVTLVSGPLGGLPKSEMEGAVQKGEEMSEQKKSEEIKKSETESERMKAPDKSAQNKEIKPEDVDKKIRSTIEKIKKEARKEEESESYGTGGSDGSSSGIVGPYGSGGLGGTIASFYLGEVWDSIRRNWSMPKAGVDTPKDAHASFLVKIDAQGHVTSMSLLKASGYDLFDNSALAAIKKAEPFSPPPSMLVDTLSREGIEVRFFAQEVQK